MQWTDASGNVWLFGGDGYGATASGFWLNDFWKWDGETWTWVGGSNGLVERGVYGTKGVPDPLNAPGARHSALSFTDTGGNLWLFGGNGIAANSSGFLNDLWKWNRTSWTWVKGSNESNQIGSYGTRGVPATGNTPGARRAAVSWTDAAGNFWLFGGDGADYSIGGGPERPVAVGWDPNWTWMSGSNAADQAGTYGEQGVPASGNVPGAREVPSRADASGNLWLFGGTHETANGLEMRNDLWRWDGTNWTWMSGSNEPNQLGIYGTKGVAAPANRPGARHSAVSWTDASGSLWLFGGYGQAESLTGGLNDLWKWDGKNWTWKSGERWPSSVGYVGTKGEAAPGYTPGARSEAVSWRDESGNLWLSGGLDYRAMGGLRYLNDTWRWDGTNWAWMSGTDGSSLFGTYGPPGVPLPGNLPGARIGALAWTTADGSFSVFGGGGFARSSSGALNDLWLWDGTSWTWANGSDWPNVPGTHGTKGVPAPENVPGSRGGAVSWTDSDGHFWLMGGSGPGIGGWGDRNDLWTWDGASWTWVSGSEEANQPGIYGTNGVPAPENVPGGRSGATSWTDGSGSFWLYGGYGQAESWRGYLNDLWKWNGTAWTWMNGSREPNHTAVYGMKGIPALENTPGSRVGSTSWRDTNGDFWLFGGSGAAAPEGGMRNDLWKWDGTSWTWVSGSNLVQQDGFYGTKGVGAPRAFQEREPEPSRGPTRTGTCGSSAGWAMRTVRSAS
ncbi:MAG: hypothetical protein IPF66_02270 [Holophagales bacterium]|nr:hypothetical protein [Holophagales bacterium]